MSNEYEEHSEEMELPKGSGIPGLLKAIEGIANLPRVQGIRVHPNGKIEYNFFLRKGETKKLAVSFEDIMPYAIARNGTIVEIPYPNSHPAIACAEMFRASRVDQMYPVAFLGGADSKFWGWWDAEVGAGYVQDELFGLPFLTDRMMEDAALLLCTAYKKHGVITDTVTSYKITIPRVLK